MKHKLMSWILLIAAFFMLLPADIPDTILAADEMSAEDKAAIERKMRELDELNKAISDYQKRMNENTKQQKSVIGQLKSLQQNMEEIEKEIKNLDIRLNKTQENIKALEENIAVKTEEVNERNSYLEGRLRQIYIEGEVSYLDVLFSSTSITDFLTRYDLMAKIVENDMQLLAELKAEKEVLEDQKAQLEAAKQELLKIKADQEARHQDLEEKSKQQEGLLKTLESDKEEINKALDELEEAQKEIEKFVASIQSKYATAYMGSGVMGWPVPGYTRISSSYGNRIHPITKKQSFHTGIDIPAPKNTPALAAEKGKVIYAGNQGAYGNTVILDHGGGISTQYSHLNTIGVKVGQIVLKGESVGGIGTTGWSTGNHLHFTIMKNGKTVNPLDYVKKP